MKLIIDTNIIHGDFHLKGARISKLCSASTALGYELMIPEVVFDEVVNQYRRELEKYWPSYEKMISLVGRTKSGTLAKELDKKAFFSAKMEEYIVFLSSKLKELGIKIVPYPAVDLKKLISKEMLRKKPFKEIKEHGVGYRDALIWETVISLCAPREGRQDERPQVEFLTENTVDFAGADGRLHQDLVDELIDKGLLGNSVQLIPNAKEFFETRIDSELLELDNIKKALLTKGRFNRFDLEQELLVALNDSYLERELFDSDFDSGDPRFIPGYFEEPSISGMDTPIAKGISVRKLVDESVLIEIEASLDVTIDFFVYTPDYYNYLEDDKSVFVIDWNWNEHYILAQRDITVIVTLSFKMTPAVGKILSSECVIDDVRL